MTSKPFGQNWAALVANEDDWGAEPCLLYDCDGLTHNAPMCEVLPPLPASDAAPPASWVRRLMSWGTTWA